MADKNKFRFSIDRGGTFTDIYAEIPGSLGFMTMKLLSEDPDNYSDAAVEGIRRIIEKVTGEKISRERIDQSQIEWIRMGTTLATNALLERKGARTGLVITMGFGDLLQIGYQNRPDIFDIRVRKPEVLYEAVIEVDERVRVLKPGEAANRTGITGEGVEVIKTLDLSVAQERLEQLLSKGITSLAVVLMNAYTFPDHEKQIGKLARDMGFEQVSLSHEVMPSIRIVSRGDTTTMDAYLTPKIMQYITNFKQGFLEELKGCKVLFMQSFGGLIDAERFTGSKAILSGPAGGVVGYAMTCFNRETGQGVIGFDMGGTSTDVSRYSGEYELVHETETGGIRIQAPQMHIVTVAAGGGSRLFYETGRLQVGPESTGAHPGPVCYRKGGALSITDANLVLGRLNPDFFPKIFGPEHKQPLDSDGARQAIEQVCHKINNDPSTVSPMTVEEVALGFIEVANETMARAIRQISVMRGYDLKEHMLACFGGAGGQHACSLARRLGISKVIIHRFAGILSAYGLGLADVVREFQSPAAEKLDQDAVNRLEPRFRELEDKSIKELKSEGFSSDKIQLHRYLNLRYDGTNTNMMVQEGEFGYKKAFIEAYIQEYGFELKDRTIIIDDLRIRAVGKAEPVERKKIESSSQPPLPKAVTQTWFEDRWVDTNVYLMEHLKAGQVIEGPALVIQNDATIVVETGCTTRITNYGDIEIDVKQEASFQAKTESDPVQLSIFNNLFMSIAEQMGRTLQRTAISTNIKERLDFSCAIFDRHGNLIANAPHIPVHLGSMGEAVKRQIELLGNDLKEGDVIVTNDPHFGGTHLPDITVITPVFVNDEIVFFTASRGHHADVGGISPGSIPPFSKTLAEEGVCIRSFKLVENGNFQEAEIRRILGQPYTIATPHRERQVSGCRNLEDSISDLKAQTAANNRGRLLLIEIARHYGLDVVLAYMGHIRDNAERSVREMLKNISLNLGLDEVGTVEAAEYLDDGSPLCVKVTIDRRKGTAHFDFTGSGKELDGNLNCPYAVTISAVLYVLRSLVTREIPLNAGCLAPITITIPSGSFLAPNEKAAVVAGNVETSNRITDCTLKAFRVAAGSQGTLNNLTFGDDTFGYYETIGGGAGAGPDWHGQSGVHTHMSNTRITDPEILERRYPVLVRQFSIRYGSGGKGKFNGGDGLIRDIEFLKPMHVAILSERRVYPPYGLEGGEPGQTGKNLLIRKSSTNDLGGKNEIEVEESDRIRIATPGGGGFGQRSS